MTDLRRTLRAQGIYYVTSGPSAFVSRRAFEAVTGRKRDWWLVQTVGLLVTTVGAGLLSATARDRVTPEVAGIAAGTAASLAAIDVVHVTRGRIRATYLLDAALEAAFATAVARGVSSERHG
jgi:hypothetical protein